VGNLSGPLLTSIVPVSDGRIYPYVASGVVTKILLGIGSVIPVPPFSIFKAPVVFSPRPKIFLKAEYVVVPVPPY